MRPQTIAALILILLAALVFFGIEEKPVEQAAPQWQESPTPAAPSQAPKAAKPSPECAPGDTEKCTTDSGCAGVRLCVEGIFSGCRLAGSACRPGTKVGCMVNSCEFGYQVCNKCGTGYSGCSLAGTLNYICNPK